MEKTIIATQLAPAAVGAYSQGVEFGGIFYFSGQVGLVPGTGEMEEGFDAQLARVMDNIDGLLQSGGLARGDIIKTTVFLTDMNHFPSVNEVYERYFEKPYPPEVA